MVMISVTNFSLARPAVDKRLLPANMAQNAVNAYCDTGKLNSLLGPRRVGFSHNNPPVSIFRERENGGWRDWDSPVDIIRSPIDTTPATLIYTGDGKPKITAVGESTVYDLGVPSPAAAPTVEVLSATSVVVNTIERLILATQYFPRTAGNNGVPDSLISYPTPMSVTSDGEYAINFLCHISAYFVPDESIGDPIKTKYLFLNIYRDSVLVNRVQVTPDLSGDRPESYGGINNYRSIRVIDAPVAGTYDYTFELQLGGSGASQDTSAFVADMNIEARSNNVMRVITATDITLAVDNTVSISGAEGTAERSDLIAMTWLGGSSHSSALVNHEFSDSEQTGTKNPSFSTLGSAKTYTVSKIIDENEFYIAGLIEGEYQGSGEIVQTWTESSLESRAYRYTYVSTINDVDYEGPASEASDVVDAGQGQGVKVDGFSAFPGDWNTPASKIRIYRYAATSSTTGQYQYVGEIDITATEFTDTVLGDNLGESIPDPDREPPVEDLQGLIELPNGGAAAFKGKTVYLAIPNYLHAWPLDYGFNAHDDIVAIGAFGSSIGIATKSQPYVLTGVDPAGMTMDKVELSQPCLSKEGCVDFGYFWTYPCPDGLALITTGRAEVITLELFTPYQWREYNPASFKAARYDGEYVCFYEKASGERGGFMFDPLNISAGVTFLDFWADAIWTDQSDGNLYIARNNVISRFDDDVAEMGMQWRSKEFATPEVTLTTARVEAAKYPVSLSVFCDGEELVSAQVYSRQAFRIGKPRGSLWSVEVRGQHRIDAVFLAENMEELGNHSGGQ